MTRSLSPTKSGSDRGLSVAVTHVLAIGVTTVLITLLLLGASTMLEMETDRSTDRSLETVGERIAGEITNVDIMGTNNAEDIVLTSEQPRSVAGSGYSVALVEASTCEAQPLLDGSSDCLQLTASGGDAEVFVPVKIDSDIGDSNSAAGGLIRIEYDVSDDEITIESRN